MKPEGPCHPIATTLPISTQCACCGSGWQLDQHEIKNFTADEVGVHIAVTEAISFVESAHERLRAVAAKTVTYKAGIIISKALKQALKFQQTCKRLGYAVEREGQE